MGITKQHTTALASLTLLGVAVHLLPFFLYGAHPLGYDTGFYRRYLTEPLTSFPNAVVPGLGSDALVPRVVLDSLRLAGMGPDLALYGSYLLFATVLPLLLYLWLTPRLGWRYALVGGALLALSSVGYTAYSYILYKSAFALCLLVAALIGYDRRRRVPTALLSILLAASHKTTAIIYLVTLGTAWLIDRPQRHHAATLIGITGATLALSTMDSTLPRALSSGAVAVFITWSEYLTLSAGTLIAALYALRARSAAYAHPSLVALALASLAFPLLRLPFYARVFVYTDVALVALAAYGLRELVQSLDFDAQPRRAYLAFVALCLVGGFTLGNLSYQVRALKPLVSPETIERISATAALLPEVSYLLTPNTEAPWYQGWTRAHLIAPGMLRDTHTYPEWVAFWQATSTSATAAFLASFPTPLYVSTTEDIATFIPVVPACLTQVSLTLWQSTCH